MKNVARALRTLSLCALIAAALAPSAAEEAAGAPPKRPRVAVVLSGGSAFGLAHIGVLEEIEAAGIPIDMIVGTSMGAIVGGLYASGYSPEAMARIVTSMDWASVLMDKNASAGDRFERSVRGDYALRVGLDAAGISLGSGLLEGQNVLAKFTELTLHALPRRDFDALPVQYRAVAVDLMTGDKVVFDSGSIAEAMRASMSIPALFRPYEVAGRRLVDGGIADNLPVDVARKLGADIVIAVESRGPEPKSADSLGSPLAIASQSANLFILQNMRPARAAADLLITSDLSGFSTASYAEAAALVARGKAAGAAARPGLAELAARIAEARPLVAPGEEPNRRAMGEPPLLGSIRVEGGSPSDEAAVRAAFAPLVGRAYAREDLSRIIGSVYTAGGYDLVKFDVEPEGGGLVGVVSLRPDTTTENACFVGLDYSGVFSKAFSSDVAISSGLLLRGLSGKDSGLFVSTSLVNKIRAAAEYFQPLGPLFLKPWLRYSYEYDFETSESLPISLGLKYRSYGGGLWTGLALGLDADLMLGYSLENVSTTENFIDGSDHTVSALRLALRYDGRETSVFPERGLACTLYGRASTPALGGATSFGQAELDLSAAIPLSKKDTLGLSLFAGSDFSGLDADIPEEPMAYYSRLSRPGMFYGLSANAEGGVGDHAAGLGLELRHRVAKLSPLLGGDLFLLGNLSAGAAIATSAYDPDAFVPRICGSLGYGVRLARHFGLLAALSLENTADVDWASAFALSIQFGSFSDRIEDHR